MTGIGRFQTGRAQRIREAREAAGFTQQTLAEKVGVSDRTVKRWEEGKEISPQHRPAIEAVLGVSLDDGVARTPTQLEEISAKLDGLRQDVDRIVRALSLDEVGGETQEPAQLLATVVSLEQQIARLLEALGGPDAARWLNGPAASDGVGVATRAPRRARR